MLNFTAIDFETGKYSPESAVSVGAVKYRDGKAVDSFYSLIRPPELYIRPDFTGIHGLTVEDVEDAPAFDGIWESALLPFLGDTPLAAHNAQFDMGVLRAVLAWYALPVPRLRYFCTLALARKTWPALRSHALTALGKHFGIVYNAHNALDDAETCGRLVCMASEVFGCNAVEELAGKAGIKLRSLDS
jgi:DNA polymerase-3 subunit epsilon